MNKTRGAIILPLLIAGLLVALAASAYVVYKNQRTQTEEGGQLSTSTAPEDIEADLEATSFTEVDSDLAELESELNAALQE